jgi:hypothetical protein
MIRKREDSSCSHLPAALVIIMDDVEKTSGEIKSSALDDASLERPEDGIIENYVAPSSVKSFLRKLTSAGIEMRGLEPIPVEDRNHTKYYNIFTLFGGSFMSILP